MKRRLVQLLSPPMLVALLALVVATGGTSYAAVKITSKDIKDHTIKVQDLAPKTIKKLRGAAGKNGVDGVDATGTVPSGQSLTGSVFYRISAHTAGQTLFQSIPFPMRAPEPLLDANFAVDADATTTDDDPTCLGTYEEPTAPAGTLCAYPAGTSNVSSAHITALAPGYDKGFFVALTATAAGPVEVDFSWAYTAP